MSAMIPFPVSCSDEQMESRIYFVRTAESHWCKIGRAANVDERIKNLQVGNHEYLELVIDIPGGRSEECALHDALFGVRRRGEWFEPCPAINLAVELAVEGVPTDKLIEAVRSFRDVEFAKRRAENARGMLKYHRRQLVDPQIGRGCKRLTAKHMPDERRRVAALMDKLAAAYLNMREVMGADRAENIMRQMCRPKPAKGLAVVAFRGRVA